MAAVHLKWKGAWCSSAASTNAAAVVEPCMLMLNRACTHQPHMGRLHNCQRPSSSTGFSCWTQHAGTCQIAAVACNAMDPTGLKDSVTAAGYPAAAVAACGWGGSPPMPSAQQLAAIDCLCMLSVPSSQAILFTTARAKGASWCMRAREAGWLPSPPPPVLACRPAPPHQHPILQALPEQQAGQTCRSTRDLEAPRGAGALRAAAGTVSGAARGRAAASAAANPDRQRLPCPPRGLGGRGGALLHKCRD